jgi:hypothetical protein
VTPSVETLYRIADQLGLSVGDFFGDNEHAHINRASGEKAKPGGVVQRREARKKVHLAGGVTWERLTPNPNDKVEFLHVIYQVGSASCPHDSLRRHGGKEYACILSGRLGVKIGFEEYELAR